MKHFTILLVVIIVVLAILFALYRPYSIKNNRSWITALFWSVIIFITTYLKACNRNPMKYCFILLLCFIFTSCNQPKQKSFIVTKVRSAAKLSTSEIILNKIVWTEFEKERKLFFITKPAEVIMFNTEATVKMGIDLSKLSEEDIEIKNDSVIINLPKVEILNFSYPHEKFEEIFPISNFDNCKRKNKVEKLDEVLRLAETDIRNKIKYLKIEDGVEFKTKQVLSAFLTKSNFNNVIIRFKE